MLSWLVGAVGQPRGLLWFHLQGSHPSEAKVDKQFVFTLVVLLRLCFAPTAARLKKGA